MRNKVHYIFIAVILFVGVFFRFYNLASVPPSPTVDEVSIGYNAYSILNTGRDEYGNFLPILLRAYDDWRPALYVYLVIPFLAIFGLDVLSVRLPSIILSSLSVIAVYYILKELFKNSRLRLVLNFGKMEYKLGVAEIAVFLMAISPWHIYISRLGHEVNAAYAFFIFGLFFFFRFLSNKSWNLYFSSLFFALSFDSYQSTKIFIPFIVLSLGILYFKKLLQSKSTLLVSMIIGLVVIAPILISTFDDSALIRFKGTSLLSTSEQYFNTFFERKEVGRTQGEILSKLFTNTKTASILLISHAYLSHLDPVWLFINQNGEQFKAPTMGLLYLFEFPLIFAGLIFFTKSGLSNRNMLFCVFWLAVALLPGAITNGYAHPMRVFNLLPLPDVFAAIGLINLLLLIKQRYIRFGLILITGLITFSVLRFFYSYFTLMPRELSHHFQYGVIDALKYTRQIEGKYENVVVSNQDKLFESYMFYLYVEKFDPLKYQKMGGTVSGGFAEEHKIGKYRFEGINDKIYKRSLYVVNISDVDKIKNSGVSYKQIKKISYKNKKPVLYILETNE